MASQTQRSNAPPERGENNQTTREPGFSDKEMLDYLREHKGIIEAAIAPAIKGLVTADDYIQDVEIILKHDKGWIAACPLLSLLYAVTMAARTGLRLAPALKEAYLIKRWHKVAGNVVYFDPDYRGLMKLCYRHGGVAHFSIDVAHEKDFIEIRKGNVQTIEHKPVFTNRGPLLIAYAVIQFTDGHQDVRFLDRDGIARHKAAAQLYDGSPWKIHEDQMWMKSMAKDACKWIETSPELRYALDAADSADIGRLDPAINDMAQLVGARQLALPASSAESVTVPQGTAAERFAERAAAVRNAPPPPPAGPQPKAAPIPPPEPPKAPAREVIPRLTQNQIAILLGLTEDWTEDRYDEFIRTIGETNLDTVPAARFEEVLTMAHAFNGNDADGNPLTVEPEDDGPPWSDDAPAKPQGPPTLNSEHIKDINALIASYALTADEIATTLDWLRVPAFGAVPVAEFERCKNLVIVSWLLRLTGRSMAIALNTFQKAHVADLNDSQVLSCRKRLEERARAEHKID